VLFVYVSYFSDTLTAEVEATADGDMLHSVVDADESETTDSPPVKCPRLLARPQAPEPLSYGYMHFSSDTQVL